MKKKVIITSRIPRQERNYIIESLKDDYEFLIPKEYEEEEILELMDKDVELILGNYVTDRILSKGDIKFIQNPFAGVENFDFKLLSEYDLKLCNSHSNSEAVAEHALALMLSIARKIPYHDKLLREGRWNRDMKEMDIFSTSLRDKTVGIIGYGSIGRSLGRLLQAFNVNLLVLARDKNKEYEEVNFIGDNDDLDYIIQESDFLVSTVPLTEATRGMLNLENLSKMKKDSYLINVSRGEVIDEEALYTILKESRILGAGIDTWYNYPENFKDKTYPSKNFDFHKLDNIVMSPHRAPMIYDEFTNAEDVIYNLKQYISDRKFINLVDIEEGY